MWHSSCSSSCRGGALHAALVEQAERRAPLAAEEDIGGGRELLDQVQLLVDDAHAGPLGVARAGKAHRLAAQVQGSLELGNHAGEDLHQRALAGPVLADDGVQLRRGECRTKRSDSAMTPGNRFVTRSIEMMDSAAMFGANFP